MVTFVNYNPRQLEADLAAIIYMRTTSFDSTTNGRIARRGPLEIHECMNGHRVHFMNRVVDKTIPGLWGEYILQWIVDIEDGSE